jgi:hypothetical protein
MYVSRRGTFKTGLETHGRELAEEATLKEKLEPIFNRGSWHKTLDVHIRMRKS